ncbi:DUF2264 domain-containing protein [Actinospica robiniae]|uniref:DUF2264 domain-containing protein n=1 Tax=Actinospica robiniae TaxID=304901 RepID=UPI000426552B|nr:DUF2264 domain-containing protein [Actinospica robiniae]
MRELHERNERDEEGLGARAEWVAVADAWLLTAREHAVAGGSLILPTPNGGRFSQCGPLSDGIEGFCRSFLLAGARLAHGEDEAGHAEWYARGLTAAMGGGTGSGTNSSSWAGTWGRAVTAGAPTGSGIQQPIVEAANLAFGLALCREQFWDRLDEGTRERLTDWLAHHAALRAWDNNWLLFTAVIEAFLASVGVDVPGGHMDEDVERVESWYLADGWYNDGPPSGNRNIDHYNSWVIHPFLWQWYRLRGDAADPGRRARMLERLGEFAGNYARTFAPDGAPLHQGRSLTYRTAVLAGLWTASLAEVSPLSPACTRRLCTATRRHFEAFGVSGAEAPSLGWRAAHFEPSLQVYSGPGSPYFAGIGFLGLAAGPEHPLWAAPEDDGEPEPEAEPARGVVAWRSVGWLVASQRDEGVVRVANHGADHETFAPGGGDDPHYIKFGYSTHTAPGTGPAWDNGGIDGHFALLDPWRRWTRRRTIEAPRVDTGGVAVSEHTPRDRWGNGIPDTRIVSVSCFIASDDAENAWLWEIRAHRVIGGEGWDQVREGGYAVAADEQPAGSAGSAGSAKAAWALARGDVAAVFAAVVPLAGYDESGLAEYQGSNALGEFSSTPYLLGERRGAHDTVHVAGHLLRRHDLPAEDWQPHLDLPTPPAVHVHGAKVTVRLGGSEYVMELDTAAP